METDGKKLAVFGVGASKDSSTMRRLAMLDVRYDSTSRGRLHGSCEANFWFVGKSVISPGGGTGQPPLAASVAFN